MKQSSFRLFVALLTFVIGIAAHFGWVTYERSLSPYEIGQAEAKRDLQNGRLIIKPCGGARPYPVLVDLGLSKESGRKQPRPIIVSEDLIMGSISQLANE